MLRDMTAWSAHFRRWPPSDATAIVGLWADARRNGDAEFSAHLTGRFPGAFELLGIATGGER